MPNEVFLENDGNLPSVIKVDGQCFQFTEIVANSGQEQATADDTFEACHICQADEGLPAAIDCGGDPDIIVTLTGGPWAGRSNEVFRLCPDGYNNFAEGENWTFNSGGDELDLIAQLSVVYSLGRFGNDGGTVTTFFSTGTNSFRIKDRLFTTYSLGDSTITIQRGNNW